MTMPTEDLRPLSSPSCPADGASIWEVSVRPLDTRDVALRGRILERMRTAVEQTLRQDPAADVVRVNAALGTVEARLCRRGNCLDAPVRLGFAPSERDLAPTSGQGRLVEKQDRYSDGPGMSLPALRLPDTETTRLGERLVGLDGARRDLLLRWDCLWDGGLERWSGRAGQAVPPALGDHLRQSHAVHLLHGDPGLGKTALARVAANDFCRRHGIPGWILTLTTEARGTGLVGQFAQRLRAAFDQLVALPEGELRVLLIDEADALAIRRSEGQSHQEDRAATATILQALDALVGQRRLAVILTTNMLTNIDAAVRRRAHLVAFARPDAEARVRLLGPWLPGASPKDLERAASASRGMTPADIERALLQAYLSAVGSDATLAISEAIGALRRGERTGAV